MLIKPHLTQLPGKSLRNIKNTIAIASGKGGVGKSTVTVQLARALAKQGARVGILDADIYGPSIPQMLGAHEEITLADDNRYIPVFAQGVQAMSIGYLTEADTPMIWRGPMLAKSMIQLLDSTAWDDLDYLFIDLPPGTGDIQLSLVQKIPLTGAVIVTTPQTVATCDAQKALKMFQKTNVHVLGLIENMAEHVCESCGHKSHVFGKDGGKHLAKKYDCQVLGQLPLDIIICESHDRGNPILHPAFESIAKAFTQNIAKRPLNYADKFPPLVVE